MKPEQSELILVKELFREGMEIKTVEEIDSVSKLTGDASTRRYYRLGHKGKSYIGCVDQPFSSPESYSFLVVQKFLSENKLLVPNVFFHLKKRGFLGLEDFGDKTFLTFLSEARGEAEVFDIYKAAIEIIIKMQSFPAVAGGSQLFEKLFFDEEKYQQEFELAEKYFLEKYLKLDSTNRSAIKKEFTEINKRLALKKTTFCHRDFHSRNLMMTEDKRLGVIDFQDARMGNPTYDLVSLLEDCYYEIPHKVKFDLYRHYYENQKNFNSNEEFLEECEAMTIQRVFKAIGSFCYIYYHRKDDRYLKYIGFAMEKIKLILLRNPKQQKLHQALFEAYYGS